MATSQHSTRIEKDSLGDVAVPADRLWGAQTQRSLENFGISTERVPMTVIHALAAIKKAAALTNAELDLLPQDTAEAIARAADEVTDGLLDAEFPLSVWQTGSGTQTHMNVNEVLANPVGPEPQQEWIEIVNTGAEPVDVGGFELHDGAGAVALPPALMRPGQYALIVREDYDEGLGWDVVPDADVLLLRVSVLGKSGLSNSGEPLWLQDAQGAVASRFPPLSASRQGESWARRSLEAPDDDTTSFAVHAPPGASPGAPNVLSE